jgi:branched-chain amino acid transport system ATP-binding protein
MMLDVQDVRARRGDSQILHGASLEVDEGEIVAVVGRNGMGKTTLLRTILGLTDVTGGRICFRDEDVTRLPPYLIARRGIGNVPEGRGIFPTLTVADNLRMGLTNTRNVRAALAETYEVFPLLSERRNSRAGDLSGGQQQLLAIARALIGKPALVLVDEFSEGIQPSIVQEIAELLRRLNQDGTAILLVEQNARLALGMAQRGYVLAKGQVVGHGPASELLTDDAMLREHLVI